MAFVTNNTATHAQQLSALGPGSQHLTYACQWLLNILTTYYSALTYWRHPTSVYQKASKRVTPSQHVTTIGYLATNITITGLFLCKYVNTTLPFPYIPVSLVKCSSVWGSKFLATESSDSFPLRYCLFSFPFLFGALGYSVSSSVGSGVQRAG